MRTRARLAPVFFVLALSAQGSAAQEAAKPPCEAKDAACMFAALRAHPARKLAAWEAQFSQPLVERIAPATPQLVEYLQWDNIANGYPDQPRAAQASRGFVNEVKSAVADLPQEVQLLFVDRLVGIALVENLGGTGYTDVVVDAADRPVGGYIVLDAGVLQRFTANQWATWKEASPFLADPAWKLDARIETDAQDTRRNAIQYILLHELGHVLSIGRDIHPPWTGPPKDGGPDERYPFFQLSWRTQGNEWVTRFDEAFPSRKQVAYYFGAKLPGAQMGDTYAQLLKTNFPSLYAATRPGDDFAESFASYVHTVMMGKPWLVELKRGGEVAATVKACWDEPRCAGKRRLLEGIVKGR